MMSQPHVLFAVVIYGISPMESTTLRTLLSSLREVEGLTAKILVLDNSPVPSGNTGTPQEIEYFAFGENAGLARAYRHAAAAAKTLAAGFVVTLDQDSNVSPEYLAQLRDHAQRHAGQEVALCPTILSSGRVVSPYVYSRTGRAEFGEGEGRLHAINSFSAYATSLLAEKNIIDDYYWLDALDFVIYENLCRQHIPVVLMDVEVAHSLSVVDGGMNAHRLANMAHYEAAFLFQYCGAIRVFNGVLRLVARIIRLGRRGPGLGGIIQAMGAAGLGSLAGIRKRNARSSVLKKA
jgi:hypothetical protein